MLPTYIMTNFVQGTLKEDIVELPDTRGEDCLIIGPRNPIEWRRKYSTAILVNNTRIEVNDTLVRDGDPTRIDKTT